MAAPQFIPIPVSSSPDFWSAAIQRRAIVGAGFQPARQSRTGLDRVSERPWGAPVSWRCSALPGVLDSRSSSPPAVWSACGGPATPEQRGHSGGGLKGLRPRCSRAGGLLLDWSSLTSSRYPWIARHGHCASATRCREVVPAQCHARHVPLSAVSRVSWFGCHFGSGRGYGYGSGFGSGSGRGCGGGLWWGPNPAYGVALLHLPVSPDSNPSAKSGTTMVSVSVSVLSTGSRSVTPPGTETVAVLTTVPVAPESTEAYVV